jgi:hypothetical protein
MNAVADIFLPEQSNDVQAVLNYTRSTGIRPVNYTFDPPPGVPRNSGEVDARTVTIYDARAARGLSLDVSGFEAITHGSSLREFSSFQDGEAVKSIDYPEVRQSAFTARCAAETQYRNPCAVVLVSRHARRTDTAHHRPFALRAGRALAARK